MSYIAWPTEKGKWGFLKPASIPTLGADMEGDLAYCIKGMQQQGFPVDIYAMLLNGNEIH